MRESLLGVKGHVNTLIGIGLSSGRRGEVFKADWWKMPSQREPDCGAIPHRPPRLVGRGGQITISWAPLEPRRASEKRFCTPLVQDYVGGDVT